MALCGARRRRDEIAQIDARQSDPGERVRLSTGRGRANTHTHARWVFYPLLSPSFFFFSSFTPNNEHDQVTGRLFIQQVTPPLWMH